MLEANNMTRKDIDINVKIELLKESLEYAKQANYEQITINIDLLELLFKNPSLAQ
ncbi:hypothetical protein VSA01S_18070 [Vibrio sagamiensis NBRC 104589]|uniref:Uncharacterized protein n=1 Tax=Vibrio sagamiensis NBRC 104589 TaxID=1219064 RepID=A0A511QEG7_9VIBR|nr:hypothetical protein VSA01S_18070 [Vibrio sagamiensis NBRC 104589]